MEYKSSCDEFLTECTLAFDFLIKRHGFTGPDIDCSNIGLCYVAYYKKSIGIECVYEERDSNISVKIIRPDNGKRPEAYRVDPAGLLVREYLTQLLIKRGVRDLSFPNIMAEENLSLQRLKYRKILQGYVRLLVNYGQDIIDGTDNILHL